MNFCWLLQISILLQSFLLNYDHWKSFIIKLFYLFKSIFLNSICCRMEFWFFRLLEILIFASSFFAVFAVFSTPCNLFHFAPVQCLDEWFWFCIAGIVIEISQRYWRLEMSIFSPLFSFLLAYSFNLTCSICFPFVPHCDWFLISSLFVPSWQITIFESIWFVVEVCINAVG